MAEELTKDKAISKEEKALLDLIAAIIIDVVMQERVNQNIHGVQT